MAKKKKRKDTNSSFSYSVELTGLILILIGIIGMGFGPIGVFIKEFAMFLAGEFWALVLFGILFLGIHMLFKRKLPKFISTKLLGFYLILIIILALAHFDFIDKSSSFKEMFTVTYNNYMERTSTITNQGNLLSSGDSSIVIGGGIIGCLVLSTLSMAFGKTGSIVVIVIIGIFAIVLAFNITVADIYRKIISLFKRKPKEETKKEYIVEGDELVGVKNSIEPAIEPVNEVKEEIKPKDNKIVITSIDELKSINTEPVEVKESLEPHVAEEVIDDDNYHLPKFDLLTPTNKNKKNGEEAFVRSNQEKLERALNDFDIKGKVVEIHVGPAVTEYEIVVPNGTKVSRIVNINKEIALAMAAKDVRIQAPIPGKSTIGIEIPNREISSVNIREVLENTINAKGENKVLVALGKDIMGKSILCDLTKMPHLLVAGSTGSGKSVCINTIIASILMRYKPNEVKLVLVDPKKLSFQIIMEHLTFIGQ